MGKAFVPKKPPHEFDEAYIIGAGFSGSFGNVSLVKDFYKEVLRYVDEEQGAASFPYLRGQLECFKSKFGLSSQGKSANESVDVIGLFTLLHTAHSEWGDCLPEMEWVRCSGMLTELKKVLGCLYHKNLLDLDIRDKIRGKFFESLSGWVPIVSLNWDNLLEYGLYEAGQQVVYEDADWHYKPRGRFHFRERCFVFKPHGSIDWFEREGASDENRPLELYYPISYPLDKTVNANDKHKESNKQPKVHPRLRTHRWRSIEKPDEVIPELLSRAYEPVIITLGHGKLYENRGQTESDGDPYARLLDIFERAADFLARAKRIIVIGYSMPEDDYEIELLLKSSILRHRDRCRWKRWPEVVVVDPDKEGRVRKRFKQCFHKDVRIRITPKGTGFDRNLPGGFDENKLEKLE